MKKFFAVVLVAMMSLGAFAQHEIGAVVGGLTGLSYKYWVNDNIALQADLAVGLTAAPTGAYYRGTDVVGGTFQWNHYDFMLNPSLLYHYDVASGLKLYSGVGVGIGLMQDGAFYDYVIGKFVANANVGIAYEIPSAPVVLALDFRPGYGLGFYNANSAHFSMFDWKLGFAVRYKL